MREYRFVRWLTVLGFLLLVAAQPAGATRTVFDSFGPFYQTSGYCSPSTGDACAYAMPFSVQIGSKSYNNFYLNSNGTLSFVSIEPLLSAENSFSRYPYTGAPPVTNLAVYGVPIFSPNFSDGPGYWDEFANGTNGAYDGNFVGQASIGANSFTASWYPCEGHTLSCGLFSVNIVASAVYDPTDSSDEDLQGIIMSYGCNNTPTCPLGQQQFLLGQQNLINAILNVQPIYTMTLTDLSNGFRVDYSYDAAALAQTGVYGFSLPSGTHQITGLLEDRSYLFNPVGHWRQRGDNSDEISQLAAVPEPSTWMTMLLGFAMMGSTIRRKRLLRAA